MSLDRLHWQCRRGMLELDELLGRFVDQGYLSLDVAGKNQFEALLCEPDPDLYAWLVSREKPVPQEYLSVTASILRSQLAAGGS